MFTPKRIDTPELLDEHDAPRDDMERSLRDLRRFNSMGGGARVYRRLLRRFNENPQSILDVATGTADNIENASGFRVGVDFKIDHLLYMRNGSGVRRVVADALRLPFRNNAFEIVTSAHFFHHLTPDPECDLDYIPEIGRRARIDAAVCNTIAFGSKNSALVLKRV